MCPLSDVKNHPNDRSYCTYEPVSYGRNALAVLRALTHTRRTHRFPPWKFSGTPPQVDVEAESGGHHRHAGTQTTQPSTTPASAWCQQTQLLSGWRGGPAEFHGETMADAVRQVSVQLSPPRGLLPWLWVYTPLWSGVQRALTLLTAG